MAVDGASLGLVVYMGWGIATSPLPLAGMAVMLLSDQARRTAATFTAVWFACQVVAITAFTSVSHALVHLDVSSHTKRDIAYGLLAVGVCLLPAAAVMALRNRRHPSPNAGQHTKDFLDRAATAGPREAASMAFATAALNITNVPYWAAIALVIERAHTNTGGQVLLILVAAFAASITFLLAWLAMLLWGDRLHSRLEWLRDTLVRNAGSVVPGLLAITGVICIALAGIDLGWW